MNTTVTASRHYSKRRGAVQLETALILPLFLAFWFGICDWGIAFWIHETVVHRANAAVRWQVVNSMCTTWNAAPPRDNTCVAWDDTRIKKMFLYGDPDASGSGTPWFSLTAPTIDVRVTGQNWKDNGRDDMMVTMTVSDYQWMHFTPFFGARYFGRPVTVSLPAEDLSDGL